MNFDLSKYIDLKYFILALSLGLLYLHIMKDPKKVVLFHPTPHSFKDYLFKDLIDNCYQLNMKEVSCYENEFNTEDLPKNDF
tara:strand:+ start:476 stop:721 length:246 start_codon:yes stop_codon:yes gene_type:complete